MPRYRPAMSTPGRSAVPSCAENRCALDSATEKMTFWQCSGLSPRGRRAIKFAPAESNKESNKTCVSDPYGSTTLTMPRCHD